uniref:CID domain-containing protein n=1 Tax=Ursus americanus TaxID=9643 RepID=A0A452QZU6_URSAM
FHAFSMGSSLDRKFQSVTNTMESIQGLSSWCIENKKHHTTIVYHWMKWLRRCECWGNLCLDLNVSLSVLGLPKRFSFDSLFHNVVMRGFCSF